MFCIQTPPITRKIRLKTIFNHQFYYIKQRIKCKSYAPHSYIEIQAPFLCTLQARNIFHGAAPPHPRRRTRSAKNKHCARLNTVLKLKDFTRATDRRVDSARVQVQGFGHSQASKAVWANTKQAAMQNLIGTVSTAGTKIQAVSPHFSSRALSREISAEDILDCLTNPLKLGSIREDRSQQMIGEFATVVLNVDSGKLVTVWKTKGALVKKLKGE